MFNTSLNFAMQQQEMRAPARIRHPQRVGKWRFRLGSSSLVFYCGRVEEKWIFATLPYGSGAGISARDQHKAMRTAAPFAASHVDDA